VKRGRTSCHAVPGCLIRGAECSRGGDLGGSGGRMGRVTGDRVAGFCALMSHGCLHYMPSSMQNGILIEK
jgi:hypothetical protein